MNDLDAGYSLVEVLVATAILAAVTLLACRMAGEAQVVWRAENTRVDLQQRTRVAVDTITRALLEAGGGPDAGTVSGPLLRFLAPILPRRTGLRGADAPVVVRRDAFTVVRAVAEAEQASLFLPLVAGATTIELAPSSACALPACGFTPGTHAMVFDARGNHDIFTVLGAEGRVLTLRHHGSGTLASYPSTSPVVQVQSTSYYFESTERLLRRYDGDAADSPLLDDVVGVEVEYYGDRNPPLWPRPGAGISNCLYGSDGTYYAALMPVLPGTALVRLGPDLLRDGPWCGSGGTLFDADLLRVRRIRVTLRLQASDPAVRGADPLRFRQPGTARESGVMVPDTTIVVDVSPRNLAQGW